MKHALSAALLSLLLSAPSLAFKAEEGFGVGFAFGTPSGISGSLPMGQDNAINGLIGYDLGRNANLRLHADYVWHVRGLIPVESGSVSLFYGPGAFAALAEGSALGIRFVGGIDYRFQDIPVQLFFEVAPGINVLPDTEFNPAAGLGVRYFF
jgi:hypothetical protein